MPAQIRYCRSADGTRIAYYTEGEAERDVLVLGGWMVPREVAQGTPFAHAVIPDMRRVGVERRGMGASQREVADFSMDTQIADLLAVADAVGTATYDLIGFGDGGAVMAAFAARYPNRVRRFVWDQPFARGADVQSPTQTASFVALIRNNWALARRTIAALGPALTPDAAERYTSQLRQLMSAEVAAQYVEFWTSVDLTEELPRVAAQTLLILPTSVAGYGTRSAHEVASLIPNCELTTITTVPTGIEAGRMRVQFLRTGSTAQVADSRPDAGALHTVLFTDIESSTEQTQTLGDAIAHEIVQRHNAIVRDALVMHGGREIKHTGDGIMASFPTASRAAECAIAIQEEARGAGVRMRLGLNAGEPITEGDDLFGTTVQLARRVCDTAPAGAIFSTNVVRELCAGKSIAFEDQGEVILKGFTTPVRLYAIHPS